MENAEIRKTLQGLEQVWQRVGRTDAAETARRGEAKPPLPGWPPPPPPPAPGPPAPPLPPPRPPKAGVRELRELIEADEQAAQRYRELSRKTRGRAAAQLLGMAAERSRDARALQEQYYLLTGDSLRVQRRAPERTGLLQGLRLAWSEEAEYTRALDAYAEIVPDPEDRAQLRRMAEAAGARRKQLRALLRGSIR